MSNAMPNRFSDVKALVKLKIAQTGPFPEGDRNDAARMEFMAEVVLPYLNIEDDGNWGFVTKTDIGNFVPCDKGMWRPTGESVDMLTGQDACWIPFPPGPSSWLWTPIGGQPVDPNGPVDPVQPPSSSLPYDEGQVVAFIEDLKRTYPADAAADPGRLGVTAARMTWDACAGGMGWEASRAKHLANPA